MKREPSTSVRELADLTAPRLWGVRCMALLGALLALAGGLELHPAESGHALGLGADPVFLCADGDTKALHVEAAQAVDREPCPGCLHRLHTSGAEASAKGSLGGLPSAGSSAVSSSVFVPAGSPSATRSRAPPLS